MHNLVRYWWLCNNCVTLEQVAWLSCQKATLQRGIAQAVIVDTLLSAHKLLANLTSPISIFLFFSGVNYTLVETNQQQDHTRLRLLFSDFQDKSTKCVVSASVNLPNCSGGWKMKAAGP